MISMNPNKGTKAIKTPTWKFSWGEAALYPEAYGWLVLFSTLDFIFTWVILSLGGREVNPLADAVYQAGGFPGMSAFKFILVGIVILICEFIGRKRFLWARNLVWFAAAISAVPVIIALSQLLASVM